MNADYLFERRTFTAGCAPVALIRERLEIVPFRWELQGIDSATLEAALAGEPERHLSGGELTTDQALTIIARLWSFFDCEVVTGPRQRERYSIEELQDNAYSLRGGILGTLNIEEI